MSKLSEAQQHVLTALANGADLKHSAHTGSVWRRDGRFTIAVRQTTFNALCLRGLIAPGDRFDATTTYNITPAGRAALSKGGRRCVS